MVVTKNIRAAFNSKLTGKPIYTGEHFYTLIKSVIPETSPDNEGYILGGVNFKTDELPDKFQDIRELNRLHYGPLMEAEPDFEGKVGDETDYNGPIVSSMTGKVVEKGEVHYDLVLNVIPHRRKTNSSDIVESFTLKSEDLPDEFLALFSDRK